jgi:hypothetical protein
MEDDKRIKVEMEVRFRLDDGDWLDMGSVVVEVANQDEFKQKASKGFRELASAILSVDIP